MLHKPLSPLATKLDVLPTCPPSPTTMVERRPLKVVIIGAGIAGLAAATVLRKAHDVTVYEKNSKDTVEPSNAVGLGPNGSRMAQLLGLSDLDVQACTITGYKTWTKDLHLLYDQDMDYEKFTGSNSWTVYRQDLKDALLASATAPGTGRSVDIVYDKEIDEVDAYDGLVIFSDGTQVTADLIVGADGVHSKVRPAIEDITNAAPVPANLSFFRFSIPYARLQTLFRKELPAPFRFSHGPFLSVVVASDGSNRNMAIYPCRSGSIVNFGFAVPDHVLKEPSSQSWYSTGSISELLSHYEDFPAWTQTVIRSVSPEDVRLYQVRDLDPLDAYVCGKTVLIGDAAHPMTPHMGQGTNQALEDAEGLSILLNPKVNASNITDHLYKWEAVRKPRASEIQLNSRVAAAKVEPAVFMERLRFIWDYHGIDDALDKMMNHLASTYLDR
ncbi:FAD-binding domain-containing protein 36 [Elsinoe australis]|uniref:FAD-binding domain-containing protein 36 n=1 Tax=Elsinoe australis TaxID=40998 RepID=A0A4U7ASK6_9PEZI|nr:FAD-binding domain-containing protein 36 [Elsinoe australis]